jgi:hypothetical protein
MYLKGGTMGYGEGRICPARWCMDAGALHKNKGRRERRPGWLSRQNYCRFDVVFFLDFPKLVSTDAPMLASICLAASA